MLHIITKAQALSTDNAPYIKLYRQKNKDGEPTDTLIYSLNTQARKTINDAFGLSGDKALSNQQIRYSGTQGEFLRKFVIEIIEGDTDELIRAFLEEGDDKAELKALIDKIKTIEYKTEE